MDAISFTRLVEEQKRGIEQTDEAIGKLQRFQDDYNNLIPKIQDLQKSLSKPALLPFGRRALIPGRLIHTNELLAHLGGDHFAELSVHQTVELLKRRSNSLATRIDGLCEQKKLLQDRLNQVSNEPKHVLTSKSCMSAPDNLPYEPVDYGEGEVEIREEYHSDIEEEWRKSHAASRARERKQLAERTTPPLTRKRVRFKLPDNQGGDEFLASDTSSSSSDDHHPDTFIRFSHSSQPSPRTRPILPDLSSMTIAESVDLACGRIKLHDSQRPTTAPFSNVVERTASSTQHSNLPAPDKKQSKFRQSRAK